MVNKKEFTEELIEVFNYIIKKLKVKYPTNKITIPYFVVSILENEDCLAYKALSKIMLSENMNTIKEIYYDKLTSNVCEGEIVFDSVFDECIEKSYSLAHIDNNVKTNSAYLLRTILDIDDELVANFKYNGVTYRQMQECIKTELLSFKENIVNKPILKSKSAETNQLNKENNTSISIVKQIKNNVNNEVEKNLINLNKLSADNKIEDFIGGEDKYDTLFTFLSKKYNNNVIVLGKTGVGKTAFVKNLANLINANKAPETFNNKQLMLFDFVSLISGTLYRGAFESRFRPIIESAKNSGNYIFYIDDIYTILNNKMGETDIESLMNMILNEKNIQFICTATEEDYSSIISNYPSFRRKLQKITIEEPSIEDNVSIITQCKKSIEDFHNVFFPKETVSLCIDLCKRYITEKCLPDSAIDIIDEVGARVSLNVPPNLKIEKLKCHLDILIEKEKSIRNNAQQSNYEELDEIVKEIINTKSMIAQLKKEDNLNKMPQIVTTDDIRKSISEKTGIPLNELSLSDKEKLKNINSEIKKIVIGQDEAVDEVCQIVKRQRIGLANPTKPSVLFFGGYTGTGKTFLAKTLAEKVFGDEKYMVRLDMSEYSDKTSTNKLIGAGAGYVGYEKGGVLTEAIKKKKYCVLLLDEIEKADEEVHNMFLQIFDEGRLTDNKGNLVDFKNVVIIMTSNVGASELSARGSGVGFVTNKETLSKSIVSNELKKKFKPEFLNRIDKIIYFNRLNEDNLKNIIKIEINKVNEKLQNIGYSMDETLMDEKMVENIYKSINENTEYGARPIIREVEKQLENKIIDIIIDGETPKGYVFTEKDIL